MFALSSARTLLSTLVSVKLVLHLPFRFGSHLDLDLYLYLYLYLYLDLYLYQYLDLCLLSYRFLYRHLGVVAPLDIVRVLLVVVLSAGWHI